MARPLPQETAGPRLRVLAPRRYSARTVLVWTFVWFFAVLAGAVTIQAQRIETQHRIDAVEAELASADELHRRLLARVAAAESPDRLVQEARRLGMVDPGPVVPLLPTPPRATRPAEPPPEHPGSSAGSGDADLVAQGAPAR